MTIKKSIAVLLSALSLTANYINSSSVVNAANTVIGNIPEYSGTPYVEIDNSEPNFDNSDITTLAFETYSDLDDLGRCGVAYANICNEIMPTEDREDIGSVEPTGWHSVKYDCVEGKYLYNRCHLIGFQLAGENANEHNLITGTRYMNVDGMLPFENMVDDYVEETDNHVLYRVTPDFEGDNLVADGVQIEAYSVEDNGEGICYNVYCYNVQPGITIDYATGKSRLAAVSSTTVKGDANGDGKLTVRDAAYIAKMLANGQGASLPIIADFNNDGKVSVRDAAAIAKKLSTSSVPSTPVTTTAPNTSEPATTTVAISVGSTYVLNTSTKKIHLPSCSHAKKISDKNKATTDLSISALIAQGYTKCKTCLN